MGTGCGFLAHRPGHRAKCSRWDPLWNSHTRDVHSVLTSGNQCGGVEGKGPWSLMDVGLNLSFPSAGLVTLGHFLSLTERQLSHLSHGNGSYSVELK